jgi:hypothetical protein
MTAKEWVNVKLPGIDWRFCRIREFSSYGKEFVECAVLSGYGTKMTCHYPELVFTKDEFYGVE